MISMPAAASAGLAVFGLALLFAPRAADPAIGVAAEALIRERAAVAVAALDELRAAVEPALDAARIGAAGVLSGDDLPSPRLAAAAALIVEAEEAVVPARSAVAALAAAQGAWRPDAQRPPQPIAAGDLTSIGTQLTAAGEAADAFADMRARGTGLPGVLDEVFRALDRGDRERATDLTAQARADHDTIVAWETDLVTLPVWIETTGGMITAVERILEATRTGDDGAATEAAESFVALSEDAATADRALRIALSEGGSALTAAPLERLAAGLGGIEASRAAAAALLMESSR
ncbi:MAG: hypothetical protein ACR2GO_08650 [Candidatus Limnocylindria bacterium]